MSFEQYLNDARSDLCDSDSRMVLEDCGIRTHVDSFDRSEKLLNIADEAIHVFPLSSVKHCWFKLYTNASIAKAVSCLLEHVGAHKDDEHGKVNWDTSWVGDVVAVLDRALIIAGGLGRQDMIHGIFARLEAEVYRLPVAKDETERPIKRRRTRSYSQPSGLSLTPRLVPKLRFPVSQVHQPSLSTFEQSVCTRQEPALLTGILDYWPALKKWKDTDYWVRRTIGGRRLVPVEIGQAYTDEDWMQEIMPFKQFLEEFVLPENPARIGYLAQHDLMSQIPSLRADFMVPDYCYCTMPDTENGASDQHKRENGHSTDDPTQSTNSPPTDRGRDEPQDQHDSTYARADEEGPDHTVHQNIWFGGRTVSPLHHDPYHNILCHVQGTKYVRLYSPTHSARLYPRSKTEAAPHLPSKDDSSRPSDEPRTVDMSNNSQVDIYAMELSPSEDWDAVWPGISEVPYVECVLEAGQALYIPVGWWHYVRSCSTGISVSFWW